MSSYTPGAAGGGVQFANGVAQNCTWHTGKAAVEIIAGRPACIQCVKNHWYRAKLDPYGYAQRSDYNAVYSHCNTNSGSELWHT